MTNRSIVPICLAAISLTLTWCSPAQAQTAAEAQAMFDSRKQAIISERDEGLKAIIIKYNGALKGMKTDAQKAGKLEWVLLIDRLQTESKQGRIPLTEDVSSYPRLGQLHKIIGAEAHTLRKTASDNYAKLKISYEAALENQIKNLVKAGDIEAAKDMKTQLEHLRNPDMAAGSRMSEERKARREAYEKKNGGPDF